jgi:hypothetical protein
MVMDYWKGCMERMLAQFFFIYLLHRKLMSLLTSTEIDRKVGASTMKELD